MEKHIIRLGGAWESPIEGEASALWVRRFGRPTEMCAQARVFLVFTDTMAGELSLNNTHLPAMQFNSPRWECDITPLLCERNVLTLKPRDAIEVASKKNAPTSLTLGKQGHPHGRIPLPAGYGCVSLEIVSTEK